MLMCRPHWYMVPGPLRKAVYGAWADGSGAGSAAHAAAVDAAIQAVSKRLAEPAEPPKMDLADFLNSIVGDCVDHPHEQAGRCVYCKPCGKRLYQGTVWTDEERAAAREAMGRKP
jgi:hypothetical protein